MVLDIFHRSARSNFNFMNNAHDAVDSILTQLIINHRALLRYFQRILAAANWLDGSPQDALPMNNNILCRFSCPDI